MIRDKIVLSSAGLRIELARPGTYYQGTRFDWTGVFRRIELDGEVYCGEWNDFTDPRRHDHVCGPSEEFFDCVGYGEGESFLKVGVGILKRDTDGPYDWFHCYPILDPGQWKVEITPTSARFVHELSGVYEYAKTVEITGEASFRISHRLLWDGSGAWMGPECRQLRLQQYCHNFFTFGLPVVGRGRSVEYDAPIAGVWRPDSVNCAIDSRRVWITAEMKPGDKCYLGEICYGSESPYGLTLRAGDRAVRIDGSLPMGTSVLWSNYRVFCPEPYVDLLVEPSVPLEWTIDYKLL